MSQKLKLINPKFGGGVEIAVAAAWANVDLDIEESADIAGGKVNTLSPLGEGPVLITADGPLTQSKAIAQYIARAGGKTYSSYEQAQIDQWIEFTTVEVDLIALTWIGPIVGGFPDVPERTRKAKADFRRVLGVINDHLSERSFLVSERQSVADIILGTHLIPFYTLAMDAGYRRQFVNVERWLLTLINQAAWKKAFGGKEVKFCTKPQKPAQTAAASSGNSNSNNNSNQKKKAAAPKKKQQPQQQQPKKKAAKKKDPLASLPPTSFNLEEWKRIYSNAKNITKEAMPWFWENYDAKGWSIWIAVYSEPERNTSDLMTINLIGGYQQRCLKRKVQRNAFGSLLVLGEKAPFGIEGAIMFRGPELLEGIKDVDDTNYYKWRQADPNSEADRALIEQYWSWEGPDGKINGQVLSDGKMWK